MHMHIYTVYRAVVHFSIKSQFIPYEIANTPSDLASIQSRSHQTKATIQYRSR